MASDAALKATIQTLSQFQSTPACGERLYFAHLSLVSSIVSIHARVWRATGLRWIAVQDSGVSIHARVWRATGKSAFSQSGAHPVSIHARVWRATVELNSIKREISVSIHARVWRATLSLTVRFAAFACFNPRPRVASDPGRGTDAPMLAMFQSTPACGERRSPQGRVRLDRCFNPRPRVASDVFTDCLTGAVHVSIHARVWRATRFFREFSRGSIVSIHARVWRATFDRLAYVSSL